jgi:hypothetical protein
VLSVHNQEAQHRGWVLTLLVFSAHRDVLSSMGWRLTASAAWFKTNLTSFVTILLSLGSLPMGFPSHCGHFKKFPVTVW